MTSPQTAVVSDIAETLETNHPNATVKFEDEGECEFRLCAIGPLIAVVEVGSIELTTKDIIDITIPDSDSQRHASIDYLQSREYHLFRA